MDGITPEWDRYIIDDPNYSFGIKDCRVIIANNEILNIMSNELSFTGNTTLSPGEVLVSRRFIDLTEEMMKTALNSTIDIGIGSVISIDVLRTYYAPDEGTPFSTVRFYETSRSRGFMTLWATRLSQSRTFPFPESTTSPTDGALVCLEYLTQ